MIWRKSKTWNQYRDEYPKINFFTSTITDFSHKNETQQKISPFRYAPIEMTETHTQHSNTPTFPIRIFDLQFLIFSYTAIDSYREETGIRVPSNRDEESLDISPRWEELTALARQYIQNVEYG
jgi:hypothetical protein